MSIARGKRERLQDAIQAHLDQADELIRLLDLHDGDPDLEDDRADREPWLAGYGGDGADRELDDADDEPSLAHTLDTNQATATRNVTVARYTPGRASWFTMDQDLEAEHDGREDGCDREMVSEDEGADEHYRNNGHGIGAM